MLVISRKVGETVVIQVPGHDPIVITIGHKEGSRTKLTFDASDDVVIHRGEVQARIRQQFPTRPVADPPLIYGREITGGFKP